MPTEDLHALLARLHGELARTTTLDEESRSLLQQVTDDVARLGAAGGAQHAPRLETLAVRFEAAHPALGAALRSLVDSLSRAGV